MGSAIPDVRKASCYKYDLTLPASSTNLALLMRSQRLWGPYLDIRLRFSRLLPYVGSNCSSLDDCCLSVPSRQGTMGELSTTPRRAKVKLGFA
jgi:hypothetical protein